MHYFNIKFFMYRKTKFIRSYKKDKMFSVLFKVSFTSVYEDECSFMAHIMKRKSHKVMPNVMSRQLRPDLWSIYERI